jgi:hypothetical protein
MNNIKAIQVEYLKPNRTIETILITDRDDEKLSKLIYVYNYEGVHFKVFNEIMELTSFLNGNHNYELLAEYSTDRGLDNFLERFKLDTRIMQSLSPLQLM